MLNKLYELFFPKKSEPKQKMNKKKPTQDPKVKATRIGEIGEHKINIQLDQLPNECKCLSDLIIVNSKSRTGYSQIDHLVISPFGLFVIETKNYNGEIKGKRIDRNWRVSNRFNMYNPFLQNYGHIKALEAYTDEFKNLKYISMVSFTMRCRFSVDPELRTIQSDELIVYDVELSEFIHRKITRLKAEQLVPPLTDTEISLIHEKIVRANITDPKVRAIHIDNVSKTKAEMKKKSFQI